MPTCAHVISNESLCQDFPDLFPAPIHNFYATNIFLCDEYFTGLLHNVIFICRHGLRLIAQGGALADIYVRP